MEFNGYPFSLLFLGQEKLGGKHLKTLLGLCQLFRPFLYPLFQLIMGSLKLLFQLLAIGNVPNNAYQDVVLADGRTPRANLGREGISVLAPMHGLEELTAGVCFSQLIGGQPCYPGREQVVNRKVQQFLAGITVRFQGGGIGLQDVSVTSPYE